jgi:RNA polymerase sigma factor (sigma-70 family)
MDDVMLWHAFRSGDEKAFITVFDRFSPAMFNYGCKISPEREVVKDAVQDLFIDIWQSRKRLGDTDSIKFYLFKSLRRKLLRIKAKQRNPPPGSFCADDNPETTPSHELVLIDEQKVLEKKQKVMNMLNQLSKRQQEVLFLRYFEELNCDQIAAVMSIGKQAVYNLIYHALEELKKANASPDPFKG